MVAGQTAERSSKNQIHLPTMETYSNPLSQLTTCCFGRRPRTGAGGGFKTAALRNQFYYSPSMAHMNAAIGVGTSSGWPMTSSGIAPTTIFSAGSLQPQAMPAQPYILLTQPVIVNSSGQLESLQQHSTQTAHTMALIQPPQQAAQPACAQPGQQVAAIQYLSNQTPLHKVPSMMQSQFAIYTTDPARNIYAQQQQQQSQFSPSVIYETPTRQLGPQMIRNVSTYLSQQQSPLQQQQQQQQQQQLQLQLQRNNLANQQQQQQQRKRRLNAEVFKRLEVIEKQVDLSADMDLVERHGIVITRPIEPITLAPHLTDDMLRRYQTHFQHDAEHVIKFIEIIKRPGQTLGLYIRAVQFENAQTQLVREGIVITKIESDSPIYTSKVLHIGDEVLSINLIDIQGMSLDDVVTLMSIPKRLVLVLRIPKERESQQLISCEPIKQHQQQLNNTASVPGDTTQMVERYLEQQQQQQRHQLPQLQTVSERFSPPGIQFESPSAGQLPSQANFVGPTGHQLAASRQARSERPRSPIISHLDRQIAISQSIDESRSDNSDRFRNYSMDPEIAKLEREAMNKEKQHPVAAHLDDDSSEQQRQQQQQQQQREQHPPQYTFEMADPGIVGKGEQQAPSTLPRRTLPTQPNLIASPLRAASPSQSIKPTIINNIRLGDTPEQSNYFTSSIEAINRELKELRRQRLAMTSCEDEEPNGDRSPALNLNFYS